MRHNEPWTLGSTLTCLGEDHVAWSRQIPATFLALRMTVLILTDFSTSNFVFVPKKTNSRICNSWPLLFIHYVLPCLSLCTNYPFEMLFVSSIRVRTGFCIPSRVECGTHINHTTNTCWMKKPYYWELTVLHYSRETGIRSCLTDKETQAWRDVKVPSW